MSFVRRFMFTSEDENWPNAINQLQLLDVLCGNIRSLGVTVESTSELRCLSTIRRIRKGFTFSLRYFEYLLNKRLTKVAKYK